MRYLLVHIRVFILFSTLDDPATWAGLMAACHTENTSCYLSGSAPRRRALQQTLMSVVSEKGLFTGAPLLLLCVHVCACSTVC